MNNTGRNEMPAM